MVAEEIDYVFWPSWGFTHGALDDADDTNTTTGTCCRECLENYHFHWWCFVGFKPCADGETQQAAYSKERILEWHVAHDYDALDALIKEAEPPRPLGYFAPSLLERCQTEKHHRHVHVPLSAVEQLQAFDHNSDETKSFLAFIEQENLPPFA